MGILSGANLVFNSSNSQLYSSFSNFRRRISSPPAAVKSNTLLVQHFKSVNYTPKYYIRPSPDHIPYNYSIISGENSWTNHHSLCNNPFSGYGKYYIGSSCNELVLVLLCDSNGDRIALWNPTTNKIIKILPQSDVPPPQSDVPVPPQSDVPVSTSTMAHGLEFHPEYEDYKSDVPVSTSTMAHGLGFDPEYEDYKVLRFMLFGYKDGSDSYGDPHVELYSLKTNSWKKITNPEDLEPLQNPSIYVNGIYYWVDVTYPSAKILSFNFANEKFYYIPRPPKLVKKFVQFDGRLSEFDFVPVEFDGSIAALVHSEPGNEEPFSFKIWGWNGESWLERMPITTIDAPGGVFKVLGLFQDHKLFLQGFYKGELMLFDLAKNKLENLGIHADPYKMKIFPYVSVPQNK